MYPGRFVLGWWFGIPTSVKVIIMARGTPQEFINLYEWCSSLFHSPQTSKSAKLHKRTRTWHSSTLRPTEGLIAVRITWRMAAGTESAQGSVKYVWRTVACTAIIWMVILKSDINKHTWHYSFKHLYLHDIVYLLTLSIFARRLSSSFSFGRKWDNPRKSNWVTVILSW